MTLPPVIRLPHGLVYETDEHDGSIRSVFPDGKICEGVAQFGDEDVARARALGYSGVSDEDACWLMHAEHDLAHHLVAQALGWPWSQVLYLTACGLEKLPAGVYPLEERFAFLLQRACNVGLGGLLADPIATQEPMSQG